MKAAITLLVTILLAAHAQEDVKCPTVSPIRTFQYPQFEGQWFEIGHYRNSGPSIWAEDNFCSTTNVTRDVYGEEDGDSYLSYVTDLEEPEGELQFFETELIDMRPPGKWRQAVLPTPLYELHTYTVIDIDEKYALTYRCGRYDTELSYTVQLLSRTNTMDSATEEKFKAKVADLKLNPENAKYVQIPHGNCTYLDH